MAPNKNTSNKKTKKAKSGNENYSYFYKRSEENSSNSPKDIIFSGNIRQYSKWFFKLTRWGIYLFLAITTLWGCVQGFMIVQSSMLGHGFEIYNSSEEVAPSSYLMVQTPIAELSDEAKIQEAAFTTPAGQGVGLNLNPIPADYNYGCGGWDESPSDGEDNVNWRVQEVSDCWVDGNPNNYTQENFQETSEFYVLPSTLGGVTFGEFYGQDSNESEVSLTNGISSIFIPTNMRIDSSSIFKYAPLHLQTTIEFWNSSLDLNSNDSRYIEPMSEEELFAHANTYLDAFYNGELYLGTQDGLLYTDADPATGTIEPLETSYNINWDDTQTIEEVQNGNQTFEQIYTEDLFVTQEYVPYTTGPPKSYVDIIPETPGLHINPAAAASTYDGTLGVHGRDEEVWQEAVDSGSNEEMVNNAGWTFLGFTNLLDNDTEQAVPALYDEETDATIDQYGNVIETNEPIDYLYRTNKTDWKTSFTHNPVPGSPANPDPPDEEPINGDPFVADDGDNDKYIPFVNWSTINSIETQGIENPENYVTGSLLEFGGINYWSYSESKWNDAYNEKSAYYLAELNNELSVAQDPNNPLNAVDGDANPLVAVDSDDYSDYMRDYSGFKPNQPERVIVTDWGDAWAYGPFYGLFVYPMSFIASSIDSIFPESMGGWSVFLGVLMIVLIVRGLSTLLTFKSFLQQQKMQDVQLKVAKINAKYAKYESNAQMKQRKQMEVMNLYQKEGVNPLGSMTSIFLTMPMFLAMWRIITSLPAYKGATIGAIDFTVTPLSGMFNSGVGAAIFIYLMILVSTIMVQFVAFKLPGWLSKKRKGIVHMDEKTKKAMKKNNRIGNWMIAFFIIMSITIPTLLAIYWMLSGLFTIGTTWGQHKYLLKKAEAQRNNVEWHGPIERTKLGLKGLGNNAYSYLKRDKDIKTVKEINK